MADIVLHKRASKYLRRMDERIKAQLLARLESLAASPADAPGVKAMEGEFAGLHRLRHGDLRVIYQWDRERDIVVVHAIGPRGDIYQ